MSYPQPPWHTHGRAFFQPYLVDASTVRLPDGFSPVTFAGRAVGVLALVEYVPPSPLSYGELVWLPCLVTARTNGRRVRGYYVEKMYVDSDASLAGGRELWALPKQKARFQIGGGEAIVDTEDGARLVLDIAPRGPAVSAPVAGTTLQLAGDELVRFRGSGNARTGLARMRVREARGLDAWGGWRGARALPGLAARLDDFVITMHEPRRMPR